MTKHVLVFFQFDPEIELEDSQFTKAKENMDEKVYIQSNDDRFLLFVFVCNRLFPLIVFLKVKLLNKFTIRWS